MYYKYKKIKPNISYAYHKTFNELYAYKKVVFKHIYYIYIYIYINIKIYQHTDSAPGGCCRRRSPPTTTKKNENNLLKLNDYISENILSPLFYFVMCSQYQRYYKPCT